MIDKGTQKKKNISRSEINKAEKENILNIEL